MKVAQLRLLALVTTASWSAMASAQDAAPPAGNISSAQIGDIVVTAQRRAESAQDVPISLQSFSADALDQKAVSSTEDLTSVVGGLVVQPTAARPAIFLRGVGTNSSNTTPAVLTFVDGVYRPFGQSTDLENIERIEVLKGPQGTLFGRNATGGVIQIITKPPSETPGARVEVGYGNYETVDASAYVTGGLAKGAAMDVSLRYHDQNEGFGTNIFNGDEFFRTHRVAARSRLRLELSDVTNVTLAGDYSKIKANLGASVSPAVGYDFLFVAGALRRLGDSFFPGRYDVNAGTTTPYVKAHEWGTSLTVETEIGGLSLRNITAYRRGIEESFIDSDGGPVDGVQLLVRRDPRTAFTQELLLSGDGDGLQWVAGAFYYRSKAAMNPFQFHGVGAEMIFRLPPGGNIAAYARDITNSLAGFAQGTYEFLPGTKLTLGGRYTIEKREITGEVEVNGVEIPGRSGTLSSKIKEPTWRVALDHNFTPDIMVYASVSRGFNSGFFNQSSTNGFASEAANPKVDPEFLTAYEIGTKADLFDRHLRVNLSAFQYDYKGLQQQVVEFGATKTINAGTAEIKGIDFEVVARPVPSLTLSLSGTYLDTKYKSYAAAPNYVLRANGSITAADGFDAEGNPTTASLDAAGRKITNAPNWSYTASASHVLSTSIGEFTTSADLSYRGKMFADPQNRFKVPTRYVVNVTERWTAPGDNFFLSLWVKNLLNKEYDYTITPLPPAGLVGLHAPPRTYGASAGFQF